MKVWLVGLIASVLLLGLSACESEQNNVKNQEQRYYFLEALEQVESGGLKLQSAESDQSQMTIALTHLDQGLKLAYQVEKAFLDDVDLRLGKNFERYFIKGVENYRIGIEAADKSQQVAGLKLLQKWSAFWQSEQAVILASLQPD